MSKLLQMQHKLALFQFSLLQQMKNFNNNKKGPRADEMGDERCDL